MKKPWNPPEVTVLSRAQDAQQKFALCHDGQNGRGRKVGNCSS